MALASTPIPKFRSADDILLGFFTGNSAGSPTFAGSKSWGRVPKTAEFKEAYAIPERRKDAREMLVQMTAGLLFEQFKTLGTPLTRTAFTAYVGRTQGTLTGILDDCGLAGQAAAVVAEIVAWATDYSLVKDE